MIKQIKAQELAKLVSGLLTGPTGLGELESFRSYQSFMTDIAEVVANHCGGEIRSDAKQDGEVWYVEVHGNDSLPDPNNNIWTQHSSDGGECHFCGGTGGVSGESPGIACLACYGTGRLSKQPHDELAQRTSDLKILMEAVVRSGQAAGIIRKDLESVSVTQCLTILEDLSGASILSVQDECSRCKTQCDSIIGTLGGEELCADCFAAGDQH